MPVRMMAIGLVLALVGAGSAFAADRVSGSAENGYARLAFTFAPDAHVSAATTGGVLSLAFDRKVTLDPAAIVAAMPRLISSGHADADGKTLRFALSEPVKLHISQLGGRAVVDLAPTSFTGTMPDLAVPVAAKPKPVDVASLPEIKLRAGAYSNFTRLVFDWGKDVPYTVIPGAGKIAIRFNALARADLSIIQRFPPPWVKNAAWRIDGNTSVAEFQTDSDSGYHDFKDGNHIVLDVLAPKTDAAAYVPPGTAKPAPTLVASTAKAKPEIASAVSKDQAKAIADTAAALAPPKPPALPAKAADAKTPDPKAQDPKTQDPKAADATAVPPPTQTAEAPPPAATGQITKDGAVLTFKGTSGHGIAVFVRGLTAWVVLENAPNFDATALKTGLAGFTTALEASSSPGVSVLRVTLKTPAQIAARAAGNDLKVVIAPTLPDRPTAIGFARNQSDPRRASLTTVLPSADKAFALIDPASGDTLTVVPGAPGFGMPAQKVFADFAALPTAAGLVIAPYTDDLSVNVADARVSISRPGGMALTPPQLPVAGSPAALAHVAGGPSYLDLARWGTLTGGSFLATQRALNQGVADALPEQRTYARLRLARFYLAQGFGAESLGLINLVQTSDSALKGDAQLSTMRAAADYQMGRYRDAHNELAGPVFDSDRHAEFWRGLIDAALENWRDAHNELEAADTVISRYPTEWQARARLADTEASLSLGRLDLADAALSAVPKQVTPAIALEAQLDRARITAAESRYIDAAEQFTEVEKSGNEKLAVRAIYYRTDAAIAAGMITPAHAIETLERLRFRWRGDSLEMKTLRKLASLYFGRGQWREGLKTLRVATQNFSGDEARVAQDDMRSAFVNLYLKGAAEKMTPVNSLALFYDNIDLTPIGADGDEMIRRMADRLTALDLLGPAASLLSYQVDKRLDGVAKAQVATKLAAVQLMDRKPDATIASLRGSDITGLPDDVMHARLLLEARAFAALKQYDNALDLIGVDDAPDTRQLRADIYWDSGNWAVAGQKIEEILGTSWSDAPALGDAQRAAVLRAAVAFSLANDEPSLERLRTHFGPKMKTTPDASLFAVLSQSIDMHGLAFRDAAAQIASVDTLKNFMKDFTKKFAAATATPRS